jgi:hypothetical protein
MVNSVADPYGFGIMLSAIVGATEIMELRVAEDRDEYTDIWSELRAECVELEG